MGADVNKDDGCNTPLIASCKSGCLSIVSELIQNGADVNLDHASFTPLAAACENKHLDVVLELVKAGADVNKHIKYAPIIAASKSAGSDVNQSDSENNTPLATAWNHGYWSIVNELLKAGANVILSDKIKYVLPTACVEGHLDIVKAYIRAGTNVNQSYGKQTPLTAAIKELINTGANINFRNANQTPLTAACAFGHTQVVEELIKANGDVNLNNKYGKTPLTIALDRGHIDIVKVLIKAGADDNLRDEIITCIWLHESGVLGASSDGFVQRDFYKTDIVHLQQNNQPAALPAILEVKCPFKAKGKTIMEACPSVKDFFLGI
ncbi:kinase D-interacting substrate of 220 kDa-like [Crassostrea angulata]|uniref:kinase D-interacting substrate of 220 kDa-like n=1 Tax=Magallana angulata TaxID=2784310 RepID=UPI0022B17896|nr:kinase D-interacting substrate of 220 kDa-like [Crassostrea angulata]